MMKRLSVFTLLAMAAWAGQSATFSGIATTSLIPARAGSVPYRFETYIHGWTSSGTHLLVSANPVGLNVQFISGPSIQVYDTRETGASLCIVSVVNADNAAYVRWQHDPAGKLGIANTDYLQTWDRYGNLLGSCTNTYASIGAGSAGTEVESGYGNYYGFIHLFSSLVPLTSRIPVTASVGDIADWKFDGNLNDTNGFYPLSGGAPSYIATPYQNVMAIAKTANAPAWSNWVSLRAGKPNQLDGTASYSQADAGATVTYSWSQTSGPTGAPAAIWDSTALGQPTLTGLIFGTYTFGLTVTDAASNTASTTLTVGSVATDDNGVVVNADPNVDKIFGPQIAFGKNPWGQADYMAYTMSIGRYNDYLGYGLSPTWPYATWEAPAAGTVSYTWDGVGMHTVSATGTKIAGAGIPSATSTSFTVADITKIDVSELPTRVYVWTSAASWEEIRICSVSGSTLYVCYDGRGWADYSTGRVAAQAWATGANIGQFKVAGSGTSFLSALCPGGSQSPVGTVAYSTGTITLTAGLSTVTGSGTTWTASSVKAGYSLRVSATHGGTAFVFVSPISALTDGTHLVLARSFPSDADTNSYSYSIISNDVRYPVLHYTRATDGSDGMRWWTQSFGCESNTSLFLYPSWDVPSLDAKPQTGVNYSYMDGSWWINQGATGGLNFYGEDLGHRALYHRSGWTPALTAANMVGDMWVRMPQISGQSPGSPLFSGGLAIGGWADYLLSTTAHKTTIGDLRGFASGGVSLASQSCNGWDSRDTGYQVAWLALAALFDPDTASTQAPGGIPWRTYWRNQLSALYTREAACKSSDNSWSSGFYWNNYGDKITLTNGSAIGTGTNIGSGTCAGTASGSGSAVNGNGVITGTGFTSGTRIAVTGTKSGQPFTMWQYYTLNSSTQITLNQGAAWQGDTGAITWIVDNTNNFLTFAQSSDDTMLAESWSCTKNSSTQITLNRPWDGPSGAYYAYSANVVGIGQQPYMLGIRQAAWRWAALAAADMGNSTLAANFNSLRTTAGTWVHDTGFDSHITNGMYYAVQAGCKPITPASMGYGGGGPCFDDNPSGSDYNHVALRELTAESSPSLWSYYDATGSTAWGDLAYGSLWGYSPYTTGGVYAPSDRFTEQNTSNNSSQNYHYGKWFGFFHGMGMSHQWPALRKGGVSTAILATVNMSFSLASHPGAASVAVTVTAPSGAQSTYSCSTSPCQVTVDNRQGAHWALVVYRNTSGIEVGEDSPVLLPAGGTTSGTWEVTFGGRVGATGMRVHSTP